jgi:raffinose/stachyose/melibiose transport system substrate-binding protein
MMPIYIGAKGEEKQGLCIGTENFFAINKNVSEEKQKASLEFLEWMFSSNKGKDYVTNKLGFITPFKTFSEDELPNDPLATEINRYMRNADYKNIPWAFSAMPSDAFKKEVGDQLLAYVQGNANWEDIRNKIIEKWKSERK